MAITSTFSVSTADVKNAIVIFAAKIAALYAQPALLRFQRLLSKKRLIVRAVLPAYAPVGERIWNCMVFTSETKNHRLNKSGGVV